MADAQGWNQRKSADTHVVAEKRRGGTGTLSAEPWIGGYRIRYCLSSEKLKAVRSMGCGRGQREKIDPDVRAMSGIATEAARLYRRTHRQQRREKARH